MSGEFAGRIELDIRDSEPDWGPFAAPTAPAGAPNVLYLVWDDVGIATWDCFGGLVDMPNMSRIAERGVRLSQFHSTALCSPTRASLLTGRNPTSVGMATIEEFTDGFPNCSGRIPFDTALISEVPITSGATRTTALTNFMTDDMERTMAARTPMARLGEPEDVAACALYLASPASSYVTGEVIGVNGGIVTSQVSMPPLTPITSPVT